MPDQPYIALSRRNGGQIVGIYTVWALTKNKAFLKLCKENKNKFEKFASEDVISIPKEVVMQR